MSIFVPMIDVVPQGSHGFARVEHYEVTENDSAFTQMRSAITGRQLDFVRAGIYCRLIVNGDPVMSDTWMEHRTNLGIINNAHGHVFIAGLGLGMVLVPLVMSDKVTAITVVEQSADVIALVEPSFRVTSPWWVQSAQAYKLHKLSIYQGDCFTWKPEEAMEERPTFNTIYFDIWPDICVDNLEDITVLKRKYRKYMAKPPAPKTWMRGWVEEDLRRQKKMAKLRSSMW